jgi:hypothetical protein
MLKMSAAMAKPMSTGPAIINASPKVAVERITPETT